MQIDIDRLKSDLDYYAKENQKINDSNVYLSRQLEEKRKEVQANQHEIKKLNEEQGKNVQLRNELQMKDKYI